MAKDVYHYNVRAALEKDGWKITHDPLKLNTGDIKMEIDMAAEPVFAAEKGGQKIAVEVKSFLSKSKLHDFYEAKGQYDVYLRGLAKEAMDYKLYLAIEEDIYYSFFQKSLILEAVSDEKIAIIVFSSQTNQILQWIN